MIVAEDREAWEYAATVIRSGGLVVFPTDTVYGIGCDPRNVSAIERVFVAKSRSHLKALPLLLSDPSVVDRVTSEPNRVAGALGNAFWPGALTLVVARASDLPEALGGGDTIGVRVPDHEGLRNMIRLCGGALAATSANTSGLPDARTAQEAAAYFAGKVDLIIDGGPAGGGVPSTVVHCLTGPPTILRHGAISDTAIFKALAKEDP
jgi:L-threonylcarbamoyladenylate synthase